MGRNETVFAIITLATIIGIVFAIIFQLLYEQGIWIDEIITESFTLRELQFAAILIWEIFGIGVAAIVSK